jgi:hypothetical protein
MTDALLPVPMPVDAMLTPGAAISAFRKLSPLVGPPELKLANPRNPGFAMVVLVVVAVPPSAARSVLPSEPRTPRNGIVTSKSSPVSGLLVIGPSKGG